MCKPIGIVPTFNPVKSNSQNFSLVFSSLFDFIDNILVSAGYSSFEYCQGYKASLSVRITEHKVHNESKSSNKFR